MTPGLNPGYTQEIRLGDYTQEQFLAIALEAAKQSGWNIVRAAPNGFRAVTGSSLEIFDEEITLSITAPLTGLIATIKSTSAQSQTEDNGQNERNVSAFIDVLNRLKDTSTDIDRALMHANAAQLIPQGTPADAALQPEEEQGKLAGFLAMFVPVKGYFITPILINLNILIFLIMVLSGVHIISPDSDSLLRWGANFRPLTLAGEWWRLLTNCFIHIGIIHLLMNMYGLVYIGMLLEPFLGKLRFALAYILTGIAASVASLWWHDLTISAGASGAIFGMYGVFLALLTTNLIEASARKAMLSSIAVFVGYNLLFGLKGGIDNAAHIGGLVSGIVIGYIFTPSLKKPALSQLRSITILVPVVLVLVGSFLVCKNLPNTSLLFDTNIKKFTQLEIEALEVYSLADKAPDSVVLNSIKTKGIPNWNASLKLMDELDHANLPKPLQERVSLLRTYCEIRLKMYELLYKSIGEHSNQYDDLLKSYNGKLQDVMKELQGPEAPKSNYK